MSTKQDSVFVPTHAPGDIVQDFNPNQLLIEEDSTSALGESKNRLVVDPTLVKSMQDNGFTSMIEVTEVPNPADPEGPGLIKVVTGRRRTLAAREAGVNVTIQFTHASDDSELIAQVMTENEVRKDYTPVEFSDQCAKFIRAFVAEKLGTAAEAKKALAAKLGCNVRKINEHLELQKVIPTVRRALETGKVLLTEITSRGAGIPQMLTDEGEPDEAKQQKTLEKILAKKDATGGKSTKDTIKSPNASTPEGIRKVSTREATFIGGTKAVPAGYRAFALFFAGKITEATFAANAPWYIKLMQAQEGPGWEPAGEIQDLADFIQVPKAEVEEDEDGDDE